MQVAVVQQRSSSDKQDNLRRLTAAVESAAGQEATLVVCPEAAMHGFGRPDTALAPVAEALDGPFVTGLAKVAGRTGVIVLAGMFETVPEDPTRAFNTVVAVGPQGLLGRYRKLHLFDALGWRESDRLATVNAGEDALLVFAAGGLMVGVLTCYDLRFPELARALVERGATILAVPAAWVAGPGKTEQWRILLAARAIEDVCYVAAAAQPGPEYCGHSAIIDPSGRELVTVEDGEGAVAATATESAVRALRKRLPCLQHRRLGFLTESCATGEAQR